jgi:hypothetical protein
VFDLFKALKTGEIIQTHVIPFAKKASRFFERTKIGAEGEMNTKRTRYPDTIGVDSA